MIAREVVCPYCGHKFMFIGRVKEIVVLATNEGLYHAECPKCGKVSAVKDDSRKGVPIIEAENGNTAVIIHNYKDIRVRRIKPVYRF